MLKKLILERVYELFPLNFFKVQTMYSKQERIPRAPPGTGREEELDS